jgi:plasmid stabilization system protein ParE
VDFQIRITEAALADFEGILAYSWANFPVTAERFGNAILNHVELLKSFPYIGSPVDGRPGVRQLVHTPS